jgi:hypothetical protein
MTLMCVCVYTYAFTHYIYIYIYILYKLMQYTINDDFTNYIYNMALARSVYDDTEHVLV